MALARLLKYKKSLRPARLDIASTYVPTYHGIHDFPISIRTYERPEYLLYTINSLKAAGIKMGLIHLFDDCSKSQKKINLLRDLEKQGIHVHRAPRRLGDRASRINLWRRTFNMYPKTDIIGDFEDDIQVSSRLIQHINNVRHIPPMGLISLFNFTADSDPKGYVEVNRKFPGPALIITRNLYLKSQTGLREEYGASQKKSDRMIGKWCQAAGLKALIIAPSVVQHIGEMSTQWKRRKGKARTPVVIK